MYRLPNDPRSRLATTGCCRQYGGGHQGALFARTCARTAKPRIPEAEESGKATAYTSTAELRQQSNVRSDLRIRVPEVRVSPSRLSPTADMEASHRPDQR